MLKAIDAPISVVFDVWMVMTPLVVMNWLMIDALYEP
jgi:hypothetical protein